MSENLEKKSAVSKDSAPQAPSNDHQDQPKAHPGVISVPLHRVKGFGHGPSIIKGPAGVNSRMGGVKQDMKFTRVNHDDNDDKSEKEEKQKVHKESK